MDHGCHIRSCPGIVLLHSPAIHVAEASWAIARERSATVEFLMIAASCHCRAQPKQQQLMQVLPQPPSLPWFSSMKFFSMGGARS
mmetsp:Transcript_149066/g.263581  ORF Transcript_149066/g.263581 Transcript_149066/m.263581 type:complete len:85 (+) Transcript_149066:190-444(+)